MVPVKESGLGGALRKAATASHSTKSSSDPRCNCTKSFAEPGKDWLITLRTVCKWSKVFTKQVIWRTSPASRFTDLTALSKGPAGSALVDVCPEMKASPYSFCV